MVPAPEPDSGSTQAIEDVEEHAPTEKGEGGEEGKKNCLRNRETLIGLAIITVFTIMVVIILSVGKGNNNNDKSTEASTPGASPTSAPTSFADFLDMDGDGKSQFDCTTDPYFDTAGRLVFPSCDVVN